MGPGCYLWVFNVKVTTYPRIALSLFSHSCLVALVLSLGVLWEIALCGVPLSPSVISVCVFWQFGPSLLVLRHFFLLGVGLGLDMKWAGVSRIFDPTITFSSNILFTCKILRRSKINSYVINPIFKF